MFWYVSVCLFCPIHVRQCRVGLLKVILAATVLEKRCPRGSPLVPFRYVTLCFAFVCLLFLLLLLLLFHIWCCGLDMEFDCISFSSLP